MKKFSLVNNEAIRKHLANTSSAKVTHAFPKAQRFGATNPEYILSHLDANKLFTVAALPSQNANPE